MKKINFSEQVLPHIVAVGVFLIITFFFFNPIFFESKSLAQGDIQQWDGSSKALRDFREQTGEEGLWASAMFSGMPAYLINVQWGYTPVSYVKAILGFFLPHPVRNIYLAFVCYYMMLLAFRIRPYLAIAGAVAFGLSSYMIIGLMAGHNARIGAIAFTPLIMAGIHLVFTQRRLLGFGVATTGLSLHFIENHLQITYYFLMIVVVYGIVQAVVFLKENRLPDFAKNILILIPAALIAIGTFIGPLWGITEYTAYSIRGKSELVKSASGDETNGLSKTQAFEYSNGLFEPLSLLVPNFYGSSGEFLAADQESNVYKALMRSGDEQTANQLANYTGGYWGPQSYGFPYYAGAIVVFLFALGIAFAEKKYVWWLVPLAVFSIVMSWGHHFESFNYFLFDYLPGYNKFRSVTFALMIILFAMPLLGMLGLERLFEKGIDKQAKQKLLIVLGSTAGFCLLLILIAGMFSFLRESERQLPAWFTSALADDRRSLLRSDAFRSMMFIAAIFIVIYLDVRKKISPMAFYAFLIFMITVDLAVVDKRFLTDDKYKRKREANFTATEADQVILQDKSYYRVYTLPQTVNPWTEARTSYFHNSIGGYHGAKLRRYQDLYDSCIQRQTVKLFEDAQSGGLNFENYSSLNMLNVKYMVYGAQRNQVIRNPEANGPAWFVKEVMAVNSPTEELEKVCTVNTREVAVVDRSKFKVPDFTPDSTSVIREIEHKPNYLKYESESQVDGFAVFSEIYYEKGWKAFIDGKETPIMRADYVLRALPVPAGKHTIEFRFEPKAYFVGNKITTATSWVTVLVLLGTIGLSFREASAKNEA
ncbi:MAG TPA: YfhO family protein [Ohtaekwangia sp.]|nr:YfhO family protein [Ohtaekwangia sp.]